VSLWKNNVDVSVAFLCYVQFFIAANRFILGQSCPFSFFSFPRFCFIVVVFDSYVILMGSPYSFSLSFQHLSYI
jgi:hypothetical protein